MIESEVKPYTIKEATVLTQFQRAFGLVASLRDREEDLRKGKEISAFDGLGETRVVGWTEYRVFKGALRGMFNEVDDMGLTGDLINAQP